MRKEFLLMGLLFMLPSLAFATQDTLFWIQGELFDSATMSPVANMQMGVDVFTTATCVGSPYWTGTFPSATDSNGVYSLLISNISMDFNQDYYACVYANATLVNGAIRFRAGQGQVNEFDVDFTNLNITTDLNVGGDAYADNFYGNFIGDGSGITNLNVSGSYNETDPLWTANESSVARIGSCLYGQFVENATTGGVDCAGIKDFGLYYVSQSGDDVNGDGSLNNPYQTYQAVLDNSANPMVNIMILDPENIADQNLTIYDYRGVSLFLPVGLAPYHYGEIDNLVMGNDSSFVGHSINIKDSITCGATSWSDIYMDNGGFVNEITINNPTNCIFWFAGTQLKPNTWKLIQSNGADYNGDVSVRSVFAVAKGYGLFGNQNINFNYNGADKTLIYNTTSNRFEFNDDVYASYFIGDGSQLTNLSVNATTINHNSLNNLNWSVAGHIMDDDMVFDTGKGIYLDNVMSNGLIYNLSAGGEMQWFGGQVHLVQTHLALDSGRQISFGDNNEFSINYDADPTVNMTVFDDYNQRPAWIVNGITLGNHETLDDGTIYWDGKNLSTWQKYNFTSNQFEFNKNISAPYFKGDGSQLTNLPSQPQYWNRIGTTITQANIGDDLTIQLGGIYLDDNYPIAWINDTLTYNNTTTRFEFSDSVYSTDNMTADYFIGDGSQLTNLNISNSQFWTRGGNTLYPTTYGDNLDINGNVQIDGATGKRLYLDNTLTKYVWANNVTNNVEIAPSLNVTGNITAPNFKGNLNWSYIQNAPTMTSNHSALSNLNWDVAGHIINANVVPNITNSYSLGNSTLMWQDIYLNRTLWFDGQNLTWDSANNKFIFSNNMSAPNVNAFATSVNGVGTFNYTMLKGLNATIGNSTGNTTITPTGTTLYGTARVNKTIQSYAYNMYGLAGTYNGNGYSASAGATLGQTIFQNLLPTVTGGTVGSAFIYNLIMPQDRVTGSNFTVIAHYQDGTTETCNIVMGIGERHSADGESYSQTDTWNEQTFAVPTTQYLKASREFVFDGSGIENGNAVAITVYRNGETGADTCAGSIYVSSLEIKYLSDKI